MRLTLLFIYVGFFGLTGPLFAQTVLSAGDWYKFAVEQEGIYKLTYADLQNAGVPVSTIDPQNIHLHGNKGGMLPQLNSAARPFDLEESAITIVGAEDGVFNSQDYILFYAQGPDTYFYDNKSEIYQYERNKYGRQNFYFLTISNQPGKRITTVPDLGSSNPLISSYEHIVHIEKEELNVISSGREWFGKLNNGVLSNTLPYNQLAEGGDLKVYVDVMSRSSSPAEFSVELNNHLLGKLSTEAISDGEYQEKGKTARSVFIKRQDELTAPDNGFELKLTYSGSNNYNGYYDELLVQANLPLKFNQDELLFTSLKSLQYGVVTYEITNATDALMLWNVTSHSNAKEQKFSRVNDKILFGAVSSTLEKYILFNPSNAQTPDFIGTVENQNLKGSSTPDLLIITHPDFVSEAEKLAAFRSQHDGYDVLSATTDEIYNEFSSGRTDVTAIRDYIKYLYYNSPDKLKYVLLMGKGSYDYLDLSHNNNTNYVPIYQSHNSLHPLKTYASDDYYGFLEDDEGEWQENYSASHTLDVAVGRLPVTKISEAREVVDKLINYSSSISTFGDWRSKIIFVADDGDNNLHVKQSEALADYIDASLEKFQVKRVYIDYYKQETSANKQQSPEASFALQRKIEDGALIVNFTGHGGEKQWMQEEILDLEMINSFKNYNKLPLFVTATCAFGRHDNPKIVSGGEQLLLNPSGGGIGLVTTSRPVYASTNFTLNKAFYEAYAKVKDQPFTIGDVFKETKNNSLSGTNNRNFSLLGDPSLRLSSPSLKITVENIDALDTIKSMQEVLIRGFIENDQGNVRSDFNGQVKITLADKKVSKTTKGDAYEGAINPFKYEEYSSIIFRGDASVSSGSFEGRFTVPVDIDHKIGEGKLHLYAFDQNLNLDAADSYKVIVGGTEEDDFNDFNAPEINVYLGDTTFKSGDVVGSDALLLVHLSDVSGINITGRSFNSDITATLDEKQFVLNDYFTSSKDDYSSGWVVYPLEDLERGEHTLKISGSDIYNNTTIVTVDFKVTDADQFEIVELANAPNPAREYTSFYFMHNRAGEAMEGELNIYDSQGANILKVDFEAAQGQVRHKIFDWNCRTANGRKLDQGVYYFHVNVRSRLDGSSAGKFHKLIILN